jgi:hypothetical protein
MKKEVNDINGKWFVTSQGSVTVRALKEPSQVYIESKSEQWQLAQERARLNREKKQKLERIEQIENLGINLLKSLIQVNNLTVTEEIQNLIDEYDLLKQETEENEDE